MKGHEYGCIMWSFCSYDTQDVEVLGVYITERKFTKEVSSYDTTDNFGGCLMEGHKPVNSSIMA